LSKIDSQQKKILLIVKQVEKSNKITESEEESDEGYDHVKKTSLFIYIIFIKRYFFVLIKVFNFQFFIFQQLKKLFNKNVKLSIGCKHKCLVSNKFNHMTGDLGGIKTIRLDKKKTISFEDIVKYAVKEFKNEENSGFFTSTKKQIGNFKEQLLYSMFETIEGNGWQIYLFTSILDKTTSPPNVSNVLKASHKENSN